MSNSAMAWFSFFGSLPLIASTCTCNSERRMLIFSLERDVSCPSVRSPKHEARLCWLARWTNLLLFFLLFETAVLLYSIAECQLRLGQVVRRTGSSSFHVFRRTLLFALLA
jgi:hypothetical protein